MKQIDQQTILRTMIELAHDAILLLDPHGLIIQANAAALYICGFKSIDDIRPTIKFTDLFYLYDFNHIEVPLEQHPVSRALNGENIIDFKCKGIRKDTGKEEYWLFSASPISDETMSITAVVLSIKEHDKQGKPIRMFGTHTDITERKSAEETLVSSEMFYRSLFDNMLNGFSYCRMFFENGHPQDFIYLNVNSAFESLTGLKNVVGKKVSEVIPGIRETDSELFEVYGRVALGGKPERFERYVAALKEWFSVAVYSPKREYFVAVFDIVTERKHVEESLRESERKAHVIFDISFGFLGLLSPEGILLDANKTALEFIGVDLLDEKGKPFPETPWWRHSKESQKQIKDAITAAGQGTFVRMETTHATKDGAIHFIDFSLKPMFGNNRRVELLIAEGRDITKRKQAEIKLAERNRFIESIVNMSPNILYIYDLVDKKNIYINNSIEKILGYTKEEIITMGSSMISSLMHPDDLVQYQKIIIPRYALAKDNEPIIHEYRMRHKSGEWRRLASNETIYLRQPDGSPWQIFGLVHDITESKSAEEALRESEYFFKESQSAASIGSYKLDLSTGYWKSSEVLDRIFGINPDCNKNIQGWLDIVHPDDRAMMDKYFWEEVVSKHRQFRKEYRIVRKSDGIVRWVDGSGRISFDNQGAPVSMLGTIQDITERKLAQEALRLSEEKFSKAFMNSPDSITISRLESGVFIEINNGSMEIFGYTRDEMIGHASLPGDLNIWVNREDRDRVVGSLKIKGEINAFESLFRRKDGSILYGIVSARIIKMNGIDYMLATIHDITEQKQAEEALRQSEEKFSKAFMTSPDAITISRLADGVFIEINNGSTKIFGYTREEMIGHTSLPGDLNLWITKDERDKVLTILKTRGEVKALETRFRCKDGRIRNGLLSTRIINMNEEDYILTIARDITEQKQAEEALRQSEEKFSKAFMTSPDSINISSIDDGVFIEINNGSTKIFGYTREEMIGHSSLPGDLNLWVNKEDRDRLVESLKTKGEIYDLETLLRRKDGSILNGIFSARTIKMNGIDYILSTTRDITQQKRAEEALRQSEEKFSKAFMIIPDSITITGLSDGVLFELNNGCMKIFGYTREEMIGHAVVPGDLNIWVNGEDRDRMVAVLNAKGEVNEFETLLRRKNKSILYAIISARIIKMKGKDYILSTSRDITEQKRAEEIRNRLTRELRALSSCNQALIRAENEQTLLDEICRIVHEIAGYRLAWVGFLVNEEAPYIRVVSQAGSGETIIANETYALTDKGETPIDTAVRSRKSSVTPDFANAPEESLWSDYALKYGCRSAIALPLLDDAGNSMGVLSIYSGGPNVFADEEIKLLEELAGDLSFGIVNLRTRVERKHAQRALVYEKELSDALIEASPGIFLVMDHTGRILRMNSNFMKLQGQTRDTHTSWEILRFIYKDDYESSKQELERLSRVGHAESDARFEFKTGEISWWRMSGHAVTIAGTVYMIVTGSDITLRKNTEENLQKALKEKDVLLQELYHRTKNNMQVISSYLAMQAVILDDEKLQPIFNEMENRIRAMALVHEKLYKSKDLSNVNLREYLGDLSKLLFAGFPGVSDKVNLVYEIEKIFVTIDIAIPIGLVVTELITNSLKYGFPDGRCGNIFIKVRKHDHGELELHISDNGIGAPKGFNLEQKGTLGIPTVLSIVQRQLRGSVELDTQGGFKWEIIFRSDLYGKRV